MLRGDNNQRNKAEQLLAPDSLILESWKQTSIELGNICSAYKYKLTNAREDQNNKKSKSISSSIYALLELNYNLIYYVIFK
jgi:hypothetical protein